MSSLIIPNFYDNFIYVQSILTGFYQKTEIGGVEGSFPFSIANGGINNNQDSIMALYDNMIDCVKLYYNNFHCQNFFFDFGNMFLEKTDYENCYLEIILEAFADKKNIYFCVSDKNFIEFLIDKYPKINIILHQNIFIKYTDEDIKAIFLQYPNNIKYIISDKKEINFDIPQIFLLNLYTCSKCIQYKHCIERDNSSTLNFSGKSTFNNCSLLELRKKEEIYQDFTYANQHYPFILFGSVPYNEAEKNYEQIMEIIASNEEI